jgi:hypothetical protein
LFSFFIFIFVFLLHVRCVRMLGAACDPNGHADTGCCPGIRSAIQTTQNERPNASVCVAWLEMPLSPQKDPSRSKSATPRWRRQPSAAIAAWGMTLLREEDKGEDGHKQVEEEEKWMQECKRLRHVHIVCTAILQAQVPCFLCHVLCVFQASFQLYVACVYSNGTHSCIINRNRVHLGWTNVSFVPVHSNLIAPNASIPFIISVPNKYKFQKQNQSSKEVKSILRRSGPSFLASHNALSLLVWL